jgi:hypothetical protein
MLNMAVLQVSAVEARFLESKLIIDSVFSVSSSPVSFWI